MTGGCKGIGRAITRLFAAHGAHVVCVDIDVSDAPLDDDERRSALGSVDVLELDVTLADAPRVVSQRCEPDVVVNNVGHFVRPPQQFFHENPDDWARAFAVNLDHAFRLTAELLPGMMDRRRGGSIISLTTIEAFRAIPGFAAYAAAKGALTSWSRSMALEHGRDRIRFNTIAPDLIETPQVPYHALVDEADWWRWRMWVPLGRPGSPEDVAGAALFLASPMSEFVTGTTVHVDGGSLAAGGWFAKETGGWTNRPRDP